MDDETALGVSGTHLPGPAPDWVKLIPIGKVEPRKSDGPKPRHLDDPDAVLAETRALNQDLPIDYKHQTQNAQKNGQPAPAAG